MLKTTKRRRVASLLAALLLFGGLLLLPIRASAAETVSIKPKTVSDITVWRYSAIPVETEKGRLSTDGRLIHSTTYVPLRAFFEATLPDATVTYRSSIRTATVTSATLTVSARDGSNILYANGRCLYTDTPIKILSDGSMYVPVRLLAKTLSLSVEWNDKTRSVSLDGKPSALEIGDTYYDATDLYWLSRIISAESRGEPFIGQVAVGNVVLNRRAHRDFPNTVKEVIFDRRGGVVQFSPVEDGSIWQAPYSASVTAAKVCLEGYTVSDRILFFYAPSMVGTTWIEKNRPYAFTIAGHRFFY